MTIVLSAILFYFLNVLFFLFVVSLLSFISVSILLLLKIEIRQWLVLLVALPIIIGFQFFLDKQMDAIELRETDIVIKGNGEIVKNTANKHLVTTDKDLFIAIDGIKPYEEKFSYTFQTEDGQQQAIDILISFHETDMETIRNNFQVFKEVLQSIDNDPVRYFSRYSYYTDVVESRLQSEISEKVASLKKEELTTAIMVNIIETVGAQLLNDEERKLFSIELISE
ncbi:hypothetical protein [Sutcliffiella sp. NC1]|uniref:hypothetical protein n=1 Tax=Sutcliffiella sp. NC1 TaxID=3004096 RepID=UPI0022DE854E|nr:hypothetical protein [Sutcliffiella sp. NC1]WBL13133.1 hypothetical protein O1A01_14435 [Sutcliffiella sp. NC1]